MFKNILIEVKTVYGKEAIYPVCANAKTFAEIAGSKTLTRATLAKIAKLGFSIGVQSKSDASLYVIVEFAA
ncbi:unnamed protein product [Sphagnum tenellum]